MTAAATTPTAPPPAAAGWRARLGRLTDRNGYTLGLLALVAALLVFSKLISPNFGAFELETIAKGALPVGLAAAAQAIIVIAGGIDLSIGSMMALTNVTAAVLMQQYGDTVAFGVVPAVLLMGVAMGAVNGLLVVWTRVPDIVVTLAMSFVWGGAALLVLPRPGGSVAGWLRELGDDAFLTDLLPRAVLVLLISVALVWWPLRRSRLGLSLYAVGSDRLAAFRSGINVSRTKVLSYVFGGLFAAAGGLALSMSTGIGTPTTGDYTLLAVAAIVLGGVSLAGGRGGLLGPVLAAYALETIRLDLTLLQVNPSYGRVFQGVIMIGVVMVGGWVALRRPGR